MAARPAVAVLAKPVVVLEDNNQAENSRQLKSLSQYIRGEAFLLFFKHLDDFLGNISINCANFIIFLINGWSKVLFIPGWLA